MPGTNNFQQWNPSAANQESDAAYTSDSLRSGGATSGAIFPSATANKLFYQLSILATAFTQMMANKGYNISDANLSNLIVALTNVLTNADINGNLVRFNDFWQLNNANGYVRLPDQIIIQWGTVAAFDTGPVTVTYPMAFPTQCFNVNVTQNFDAGTTSRIFAAGALGAASCQIRNNGLGGCHWIAVGY